MRATMRGISEESSRVKSKIFSNRSSLRAWFASFFA